MTKVIGVRFRKAGKVYYFSPGGQIKTMMLIKITIFDRNDTVDK